MKELARGPRSFELPGGRCYVGFLAARDKPVVLSPRCAHMNADLAHGCVRNGRPELFPRARFALLAPEQVGLMWRYTLFIEGEVTAGAAPRLDATLGANPHYALCRRLGQLAPAEVFRIERDGYAIFVPFVAFCSSPEICLTSPPGVRV